MLMHRRCCHQQAAPPVHCTKSCKHNIVLLRMGRNYRPKHFELIETINKNIIVVSIWLFILVYFHDRRSEILKHITFHENTPQWEPGCFMRADGRTDTKLIF